MACRLVFAHDVMVIRPGWLAEISIRVGLYLVHAKDARSLHFGGKRGTRLRAPSARSSVWKVRRSYIHHLVLLYRPLTLVFFDVTFPRHLGGLTFFLQVRRATGGNLAHTTQVLCTLVIGTVIGLFFAWQIGESVAE